MYSIVKYFKLLLISIGIGVFFGSCEFKENIVFNENGGGKITTSFYGEQMGDLLASFATDSLEVEDGVFSMQDLLEESGEQSAYGMEDAEFFMENKDGDLRVSVEATFDSLEQVNSIIKQSREAINKQLENNSTTEEEPTQNAEEEDSIEDLIDVSFRWENNIFERVTIIKDTVEYAKAVKKIDQAASFGGGFDYILEYTFPHEVIAISPENASLSIDRKTITLRHSAFKVMKDPTLLDLKITFKQ